MAPSAMAPCLRPRTRRGAWPQTLLIAICTVILATQLEIADSANTNKNENLCLAVGGVCKGTSECGTQDAHLTGQLCRRHNLICCIQKDNNEVSEKKKRETVTIKKKYHQKNKEKSNSIKPNTKIKGGNITNKQTRSEQKGKLQDNDDSKPRKYSPKVIEKNTTKNKKRKIRKKTPDSKGVGSAHKSRKVKKTKSTRQADCSGKEKKKCKNAKGTCKSTECPKGEEEIPKGCKKSKTCKCCVPQSCKAKKNCEKKNGFCQNKNGGCPENHKTKAKQCQSEDCICCIPQDTKPPPVLDQCKPEDCTTENGVCVMFSDKCPLGKSFSVNYVLCQGSDCKCCLGPPIIIVDAVTVSPTGIRNKECPKTPVGGPQTCPICGLVNGPITPSRGGRVTGGVPVDFPNKYPWLVWLENEKTHRCGGAIISSQYVLTAAHCIYKVCELISATAINVIIADHNRNSEEDETEVPCTVTAELLIPHPDYKPCTSDGHDNDIALIKLSLPLNLVTDKVLRPICLPTSSSESYIGFETVVAGWGLTTLDSDFPDLPHEVDIQVLGSSSCKRFWYWSEEFMLCAGGTKQGQDACRGDSGSPLITELSPGKYTVVGIVSAGDPMCKGPGVYTRVNQYLEWIRDTADLSKICPIA